MPEILPSALHTEEGWRYRDKLEYESFHSWCLDLRPEHSLLGLDQQFCAPQGTLWDGLVLVGGYPEPGLEIVGVRSAPKF